MTRNFAIAMVVIAVFAASCKGGGRAAPPTTTNTTSTTLSAEQIRANERAADLPLIKKLWRDESDAWLNPNGGDAVFQFDADRAYPPLGITAAGCQKQYGGHRLKGHTIEFVLDEASVERDDGWVMHFPPLDGQTPQGRIYIMKVTTTSTYPGQPTDSSTNESHVTVLNGKAYWFPECN